MTAFALYIVSFLDTQDAAKRAARLAVHNEQLDNWLAHSTMPIHVVAMNYHDEDKRHHPRITYLDREALPTAAARTVAFEHFYASDAEWMVMADNDSWLYRDAQHNSAYQLFDEMAAQLERYRRIGVFFPINPQKSPFTELLADDLHSTNHVFRTAMDLKGSLFCVRNFRKAGEAELWPDTRFTWCEDGKLAFDAVALGHPVMRCENIVLLEKGLGSSSYAGVDVDRKPMMREANLRIAEQYHHTGLEMQTGDRAHLLDYDKWVRRNIMGSKSLVVPKSVSAANRGNELFTW